MIIHAGPAERGDWLHWRRSGIGASDSAGILGFSPWTGPWAVWAEKVGLLPIDDTDGEEWGEFGRWAELMVGPWFADKHGRHIVATQLWAQHDDYPWLLATPDGAVSEHNPCTHSGFDCPAHPNLGIVHGDWPIDVEVLNLLPGLEGEEIKTDFGRPWNELPPWYQTQGQQQMACCGWERVWFPVLFGRRLKVFELHRDEQDIDEMVKLSSEFWEAHVLTKIPPPIDGSRGTTDILDRLYPSTDRTTKGLDHIRGSVIELAQAKADERDAKARAKTAANTIKDAMGPAYEGTIDGVKVLTLGSQTRRTTCRHCHVVDESDPFRVLNLSTPSTKDNH